MMSNGSPIDDRLKDLEVEEFDNTKLGVKGLVDSGITRIPRIFHHPPETIPEPEQPDPDRVAIPVIDLSGPQQELVDRIRGASVQFGFFQVVNHGVPITLLDRLVNAVKAFHELPAQEKMRYYRRDTSGSGVGFHSNFDLFYSKAASWRDTFEVRFGPVPADPDSIPDVCREEVIEWGKEVKLLGERLMELLSEGLGLDGNRLKGMAYMGRRGMAGQYYPYCPEPDKTVGIASHTDPGMLTILLQDQVGGLQVKYHDKWLNLKPIHGALIVNIGDVFQIISNDEYQSGEHRVIANPNSEPRISVVGFFSPGMTDNLYGPIPELVSTEKPAVYRQFKFSDLVNKFLGKELESHSMTNYFRITSA